MAYETSDGITALEGLEAVRRRSARLRARPHRSGAFAEHNEAWTVGIGVQMEHPQEQANIRAESPWAGGTRQRGLG